ncbi:AAA family ATPase [Sphingobium cupriresistens]|uniref:AAA family ATPase n=1 Tax=Sphingobium cupriresistens TaxID=1132417 RepID=UPI003BADC723
MSKVLASAAKIFVPHTPGERPRIDTISIQNFRGFPGVGNPPIKLGSKNLLVYGENGSGKSSIFHALDNFFSVSETDLLQRQQLLIDQTNIYSGDGSDKTAITVTFVGGDPIGWTENSHPIDMSLYQCVIDGAYRKAMLDYRSLLAVNYKFLGGRINLFDTFVKVSLRDMAVPIGGSERPLSDIWAEVLSEFKKSHVASRKAAIDGMLKAVNDAVDAILPPLRAETNRLLKLLKWDDLEIADGFEFSHVGCDWNKKPAERGIHGQEIFFTLKQRGKEIHDPHHRLNEARQSGLALALYLAGRCIAAKSLQGDVPKLMVLDDVLIGLDQSNRLPVLDLLKTEFADWQIVLLTHDRVWFEMARAHLLENDVELPDGRRQHGWAGLELFEGMNEAGHTHPVPRPLSNFDAIAGNLQTARDFLTANHEKAAAVYARMAFEQVLKKFCSRKGVPVPFKENPKELNTEHLLGAIKAWLGDAARAVQQTALQPAIVGVEAARRVILNAFSHSTPVSLVKAEIESAIDAVATLHAELLKAFPKK